MRWNPNAAEAEHCRHSSQRSWPSVRVRATETEPMPLTDLHCRVSKFVAFQSLVTCGFAACLTSWRPALSQKFWHFLADPQVPLPSLGL